MDAIGEAPAPLNMMFRKISSDDSNNIDGRAVRDYWPRMIDEGFRCNTAKDDENSLPNYGYTVWWSLLVCRATIGLFRSYRCKAFALVDDMVERFGHWLIAQ